MAQTQYVQNFEPTVLRGRSAEFKGFIMPSCFKDYMEEIENMEVRDDDIWVTSFPKSGTTWTQEMVYMIASDLDYEGAKVTLDKRFLHLEAGILMDFKGYKEKHPDFECEDYLMEPIKVIKNLKGKRLIKTHLPWELLPLQIRNQTKKPKIIHVFRNPKDVCVSYYHHTKLLLQNKSDLEDYCKKFIAGMTMFSPFWNNIYGFWNRRHFPNVLFIRYEDMKRDLPSVIRKVAEFLGKKEPNGEDMNRLVQHLGFANMKVNPAVAKNELLAKIYECLDEKRNESQFIRAGKIGSHLEEMSKDTIDAFNKWIVENTKGTDFKLN
ncbi:sulfotransferase sult [Holotrichia oblita]|uniref:Sulfotransferase sult n=1 Tax=Holotrichia oblita TaxID=644536 RepID=A0ACB9T1B8_HOLOL|nr:sulfotransferase sult [Holotrichia oblita]